MAGKKEFIDELLSTFYVFDSNKRILLDCTYDNDSISKMPLVHPLLEDVKLKSKEIQDLYFLNNMHQNYWKSSVMVVTPREYFEDDDIIIGESRHSLRDKIHSIIIKYQIPVLDLNDIERTIENQGNKGGNFNANLSQIILPDNVYSQAEKDFLKKLLTNKTQCEDIVGRSFLRLRDNEYKEPERIPSVKPEHKPTGNQFLSLEGRVISSIFY